MRIIIYTGKGGVGKTSIASATALRLAQEGKKVILMSTDQAHSLKDAFALSHAPGQGNALCEDGSEAGLPGNPAILELNPVEESRKAWGSLQDYLREIISARADGGLAADEALLFPGFEELFALLRILDLYEAALYDVIIVDCAPTGETLSLLRYPERLSVVADKILPMVRNMNKALGGLISRRTQVPKPRDVVFAEFDQLVKRLNRLRMILQDRELTSLRLVMTPERIVIDEARRSYTWLQIYDFGVDAVYVNRIYPREALAGYFEGWAQMQEESLALVRESFPEQRIFYLMMQEDEVCGRQMLERIAEQMYGVWTGSLADVDKIEETDPVPVDKLSERKETAYVSPEGIFCKEQAFLIEERDGSRYYIIRMPYADKAELSVRKEDKELILSCRNETRRFRLPDKLVRRQISSWDYADGEMILVMDY